MPPFVTDIEQLDGTVPPAVYRTVKLIETRKTDALLAGVTVTDATVADPPLPTTAEPVVVDASAETALLTIAAVTTCEAATPPPLLMVDATDPAVMEPTLLVLSAVFALVTSALFAGLVVPVTLAKSELVAVAAWPVIAAAVLDPVTSAPLCAGCNESIVTPV